MDKSKRKPHFQIRKVPLRRSPPQKTPQLNALDVHSICLPSRSRNAAKWGTLSENHYQEEVNPQIIYSQTYQVLYSQYLELRQYHSQQRALLQKQIQEVQASIHEEEEKKRRLHSMRDGLYMEVENLREEVNEVRDKNYNLRWQIYHQRGAHYMNVNGFSLFQGGQMSYEQLLQMQEQMGNVPKGLTQQQIEMIPTALFGQVKASLPYCSPQDKKKQQSKTQSYQQICCICFDEMEQSDEILKITCQHTHHKECLKDWLLKQRVCPICKKQIMPG